MKRALLMVALLLVAACEAPPVFPGADKRQNTHAGRVEGQVVVSSVARGKVVLFLYDAARPPPPVGTGRPLTFTVVPREALFGTAADGEAGPFTAPFAFSLVPPGRYLVRGFLDADDDFLPWYGVTADVTQGDVGGAALAATREPRVVEVGTDEAGRPLAALDVPVTFSDAARVPVDRPVFAVPTAQEGPPVLTLDGPQLAVDLVATPLEAGVVQQAQPGFLVRFVDDNGDGQPDDANGDGVPETWPRVVVRKLAGAHPLVDENDLDRNGLLDAEGADYEHVDPGSGATVGADGKPDLVVLAAGFDVSEYAAQLVDAQGRVKATPTLVPRLRLVVRARALDGSVPGAPAVLKAVPAGDWSLTVIQQTGQTWRVPNELAPGLGDALGLPVIASQGLVVRTP